MGYKYARNMYRLTDNINWGYMVYQVSFYYADVSRFKANKIKRHKWHPKFSGHEKKNFFSCDVTPCRVVEVYRRSDELVGLHHPNTRSQVKTIKWGCSRKGDLRQRSQTPRDWYKGPNDMHQDADSWRNSITIIISWRKIQAVMW